MEKMLNNTNRRMLFSRPRPRTFLLIVLAAVTTYYLVFSGPSPRLRVIPYVHDEAQPNPGPAGQDPVPAGSPKDRLTKSPWDIDINEIKDWKDPDDKEDPNDVEPGEELDGKERDPGAIARLQKEKDLRKTWRYVYKATKK